MSHHHRITASFFIEHRGDRLRVYTGHQTPHLMVQGDVDEGTPEALRKLADKIEAEASKGQGELEI